MASLPVTLALLVAGLALATAGFLFYKSAVYVVGFLLGAALGAIAAGKLGFASLEALAIALGVGLVGFLIASTVLTLIVVVPGAVSGAFIGLVISGAQVPPLPNLIDPLVAIGAVVGLVVAAVFQTPILAFVSASWGATLVSYALAPTATLEAVSPAVLTGTSGSLPVWFFLVFGFGLVCQAGTWYYLRANDVDAKEAVFRTLGRTVGNRRSGGRS